MADEALVRQVFDEAIRAFAGRADVVRKDEFDRLDERSRARAWTVARVADLDVLNDLHAAAREFSGTGASFRDFIDSLQETMQRRGWEGLEPWHARIVFDQNVGMAYTAGRYQQARNSGVNFWRYLPSDAQEPRPEHERFYNQVYPMGDGPMPPLDFGCACSWEAVFDEELGSTTEVGNPADLDPDDQEFAFSPASFFSPLKVRADKYPPELLEALRRAAANDPQLEIEVE